jgi:hypothetical protein
MLNTPEHSKINGMRFIVFHSKFLPRAPTFFLYNNFVVKLMSTMTRWGDWNARNRELLAESQALYNGGPSSYHPEYVRKYCCCVCKREIRQGCFYQASTGLRWHPECYVRTATQNERPGVVAYTGS